MEEEKKFTQQEVDAIVQKRIAKLYSRYGVKNQDELDSKIGLSQSVDSLKHYLNKSRIDLSFYQKGIYDLDKQKELKEQIKEIKKVNSLNYKDVDQFLNDEVNNEIVSKYLFKPNNGQEPQKQETPPKVNEPDLPKKEEEGKAKASIKLGFFPNNENPKPFDEKAYILKHFFE